MAQKSVNLQHSFVLTEMSRFKHTSQFVEGHRSVVICALNMEDLISNNLCKVRKF
jgi:hypothetical protein